MKGVGRQALALGAGLEWGPVLSHTWGLLSDRTAPGSEGAALHAGVAARAKAGAQERCQWPDPASVRPQRLCASVAPHPGLPSWEGGLLIPGVGQEEGREVRSGDQPTEGVGGGCRPGSRWWDSCLSHVPRPLPLLCRCSRIHARVPVLPPRPADWAGAPPPGAMGRGQGGLREDTPAGREGPKINRGGASSTSRNLEEKQMVVAGPHSLYCLSIFERFYYFAVPGFRIN